MRRGQPYDHWKVHVGQRDPQWQRSCGRNELRTQPQSGLALWQEPDCGFGPTFGGVGCAVNTWVQPGHSEPQLKLNLGLISSRLCGLKRVTQPLWASGLHLDPGLSQRIGRPPEHSIWTPREGRAQDADGVPEHEVLCCALACTLVESS